MGNNVISTSDYEYIEFDGRKRSVPDNQVQVKLWRGRSEVRFSRGMSKKLKENGLTYLRLAFFKPTGEYFFIFNKEEGMEIEFVEPKRKKSTFYASLQNREFCRYLFNMFHIEFSEDTANTIRIKISENRAQSSDIATYKLEGAKTEL